MPIHYDLATMNRSWMLYTGMFLAAALSPLGSTMIAVALPSIGSELGIDSGPLTLWLVSSYLIVGIAAMTPGGKLGDVLGHQRCLVVGMVIYGVGSAAGFVFANLPSLALARIAMALGGALIMPATLALLRNFVPENRRARTFGYFGSVMGTAAAIGPLVGGELTAHFGWRAVFIANLPVILLALALLRIAGLRPSETVIAPRTRLRRFDIEGSVLLGAGLTLLVVAPRFVGAVALLSALGGATLLMLFVIWERRVPEPVLDLRLFLNRNFAAGTAVVGLQNLAMYALLFQLPIFFEQLRGFDAGVSGRTVVAMMGAMVIFAPIGGRLSEKIGARFTVFMGCLSALAGIGLLGTYEAVQAPADVLIGLLLVGAGLGTSTAPAQAAAMSAIDRSKSGMAGGAISSARYVGGVIGVSTLGYLLQGNGTAAAHNAASLVYALALVLAAIAALLLPAVKMPVRPA